MELAGRLSRTLYQFGAAVFVGVAMASPSVSFAGSVSHVPWNSGVSLKQSEIDGTTLALARAVVGLSVEAFEYQKLPRGTRIYWAGRYLIRDGSRASTVPMLAVFERTSSALTARLGGRIWKFSPTASILGVSDVRVVSELPGRHAADIDGQIASGNIHFAQVVK